MRLNRQFEKRGPLYVPRYQPVPGERYKRYRRRFPLAAISLVQHSSAEGAGSTADVTLNGVAQGNALVAVAACTAAGGTDFSFSGATFTRLVTQSQSNFQLQTWIALNQNSGNYTVQASLGGAANTSLALLEISGLASSQPDVTNNSGSVQTNLPINSGSVTNTVANEIFVTAVAAFLPAGTGNWTAPSGYTMAENVSNGYMAVAYNIVSSTGATNPQWTAATGPTYLYANIVGLSAAAAATVPWGWMGTADQPQDRIEIVEY